MTKDKALKLALEALTYCEALNRDVERQKTQAITAIKEALAQPEQEPVAYLCENAVGHKYFRWKKPSSTYKPIALYTTPPAQPVQPVQPKQEPVAWMTFTDYGDEDDIWYENPEGKLIEGWTYKPLYTTPQPAQDEALEPLEYWNAVEGWVKIDEVRKHFDSVGCGTIYKTAGEGRVPLCIAQPEQKEDWDAMGQKILAATARTTKRTWEDAAVKAVNKIMQEEPEHIAFLSGAYEIMSKHCDELMEQLRQEMKNKADQAKERNFCPRCGKRTPDLTAVHTCTPPRGLEMT